MFMFMFMLLLLLGLGYGFTAAAISAAAALSTSALSTLTRCAMSGSFPTSDMLDPRYVGKRVSSGHNAA